MNKVIPTSIFKVNYKRQTDAAWTDITDMVATYSGFQHNLNQTSIVTLTINNLSWAQSVRFRPGDKIQLYAGYDAVYPDAIIEGVVAQKGVNPQRDSLTLMVVDYLSELAISPVFKTSGTSMTLNGSEGSCAIQSLVTYDESNLTYLGPAPDKIYALAPENGFDYSPGYRLNAINAIIGLMFQTDYTSFDIPKQMFFWQENVDTAGTNVPYFKLQQEPDTETAVATAVIDGTVNGLISSRTGNFELYNEIKLKGQPNIRIYDEHSQNMYGMQPTIIDRKHDLLLDDYHRGYAILWMSNQPNVTLQIKVIDWMKYHLLQVVTVQNMNDDIMNGTHVITGISGNPGSGIISLAKRITTIDKFISN